MKKSNLAVVLFLSLFLLSTSAPAISQSVLARDGRYKKFDTGIVLDTKTNLEWFAGPDKDMTFNDAKAWVRTLTTKGGKWRLPTKRELQGLYQRGKGTRNMTPLLKTSGWRIWSGEKKNSSAAWYFPFLYGTEPWYTDNSFYYNTRAFAVRPRR